MKKTMTGGSVLRASNGWNVEDLVGQSLLTNRIE
jgi:hypothetical protein